MSGFKYFFNIHVPVSTCNLRCQYCYITHTGAFSNKVPELKFSFDFIKKAYSVKRLGGPCHFNFCGDGETLIPKDIIGILKVILEEKHTIFVVTNGTLSNRFETIINTFPKESLSRLGFKFSFHYLELIRLGLLDVFFENINRVKKAGCSFSVEVTPHDELIPYIEDIKSICLEKVGALCHISVARDERLPEKPIMSKYSKTEYYNIWSSFDSTMFDFKMSTFNIPRKEFCYAGLWSSVVNVYNGDLMPCYGYKIEKNIYKNINKKITVSPVGYKCREPHCFNSHAFLTLGNIPEMETPFYSEIRDRITNENKHWLTEEMLSSISHKLIESNNELLLIHKKMNNFVRIINYPIKYANIIIIKILRKINVIH